VLLTGGSQGSRTLNRAFEESWPHFASAGARVRFLHQAGPASAPDLAERFAATGLAGEVTAFIDDMPASFAQADLIAGRSGASAVAELCASGRASLLVPFPHAAGDHQSRNAAALERAGASVVVRDAEMTGRKLFEEVMRLVANRALVTAMGEAARKLARPRAAARAAEIVAEAAGL
jgi:UDP-N-acetylglucosamine--N-acetylmuramyl-(pentapeptide) pyrophosphoryl-undecaprenol N-acetylglucosamine transferase